MIKEPPTTLAKFKCYEVLQSKNAPAWIHHIYYNSFHEQFEYWCRELETLNGVTILERDAIKYEGKDLTQQIKKDMRDYNLAKASKPSCNHGCWDW